MTTTIAGRQGERHGHGPGHSDAHLLWLIDHDPVLISGANAATITGDGVRADPVVEVPSLAVTRRRRGVCWSCGGPPIVLDHDVYFLCHEQQQPSDPGCGT